MKVAIRYILLLFALLLLSVACESDADGNAIDIATLSAEPISFSAGLMAEKSTRANTTLENIWALGTDISIYDNGKNTILLYQPKTTSSAGGSVILKPKSSAANGAFFWGTISETRTFSAWYPCSDTILTAPRKVTVAQDQSTQDASEYLAQDLLYAPPVPFSYKQKNGLLSFYHQLCHVIVTVTSTNTGNIVKSITMGQDNLGIESRITSFGFTGDVGSGTKTVWDNPGDKTKSVKMRKNTELSQDNHFYANYECILPPQSGGDISTPLFTIIAEKTLTNVIQKTYLYKAAYDLEAGYEYCFNFVLGKQGVITVGTVTINNWGTTDFVYGDAYVPDNVIN